MGREGESLIQWRKDPMLSRKQCVISFDPIRGWVLADCSSTNGCWMLVEAEMSIYDGMVFKANHTLFSARIIE
jgi:pSer/pThr/pTyr-binding forkhead associated (FHA) protein